MKIMKNGIFKSINSKDFSYYQQRGWKKSSCIEPQPSQENLYVVDDYIIAKKENL